MLLRKLGNLFPDPFALSLSKGGFSFGCSTLEKQNGASTSSARTVRCGIAMIYLDYQATTPLAPEARDAMLRWLDGPDGTGFGNPHSPHRMGRMAAAASTCCSVAAKTACCSTTRTLWPANTVLSQMTPSAPPSS